MHARDDGQLEALIHVCMHAQERRNWELQCKDANYFRLVHACTMHKRHKTGNHVSGVASSPGSLLFAAKYQRAYGDEASVRRSLLPLWLWEGRVVHYDPGLPTGMDTIFPVPPKYSAGWLCKYSFL